MSGRHILLDLLDHFGIASDGVAGVTISASGREGVIEVDVRYERIKTLDDVRFEVRSYEVRQIDPDPEADTVSGCAMRDCMPKLFFDNEGVA